MDPSRHPKAVLVGDEYRVSWSNPPREPQGDSEVTDVPPEKAFPGLPRPPVLDPSWHPRGTQRAHYTARRGKKSPKKSEALEKMLKELAQAASDTSAETMQKEGSRRMPSVSGVKRKAMHATSMPWADSGKNTKAVSDKRQRLYSTMSFVVPMALLSLRLMLLVNKLLQKKRELTEESEEGAPGQANTDAASTGEDQTGDAASKEETK
ncbi:uncharacterized protein LOC110405524 isoform X2 [Numida meleagris]|nr:uncharacterized protein LOC110405524 isoform X2 [Numida meleagris]